jgi:hypothetical protein
MMYLYNPQGEKVAVNSSQRKQLLQQGWSITVETKQEPVKEEIVVEEVKPKRGRKPAIPSEE